MASGIGEADHEDLNAILLDYVEAVERGERPDRQQLLESYPEHARELAAFFATRDRVDRIAAPLRAAVEAGSRWDQDAGATGPAGRASSPPLPAAGIGRVGDFRLLREIGRGGMGVVYEAEQVSLRRRVALKVLPFASAVDPRHLQRFRNEAQAAAQLHHSNIVPVFAVGAEAGIHYYAMQLIDGRSLAQLLRELRAAGSATASTPLPQATAAIEMSAAISCEHASRRRDYFRRIAELVCQAADALAYAHQLGIVHRDVKPANLLLDGTGRLWVTDFGLAQIRNDAGLTATGEVVGTIRYMSPEQGLGKAGLVDHRTDIYSLGATLYELLTLAPVFDGQDRGALLRQLADEEPRPPRRMDRTIPAELETIVLKAIARLPADRYTSARELADDLQRFQHDQPVLARRPTLVDRAAKWVRRHRATALTAVLILFLASVGFAVSTAIVAREHAQARAAYEGERRAREQERQQAREAQESYLRTRRAVDLFVELSDEDLLDFPPLAPFRQRLLEAAIASYQELSASREDDAIRTDLDASLARLARMQESLAALNEIKTALLLDQPAVQADLALSPEQAGRLAPLLERLQAPRPGPLSESKGSKRRRMAELAAACRREVGGVLTATQDRRLRQIFLQVSGPHVFRPGVLDTLGLNEAQKAEVRRAQAEATQVSLRVFATAESRDEGQAQLDKVWRQATDHVVAGFTPAQRQRWSEMLGPPIHGEVHYPLPASYRRR